jgi:hypothetical protein
MLLIRHIRNGHQTITVTTTSHQSHEMDVSLGPQGTFVTVTMQNTTRYSRSISEAPAVYLRHLYLDEMRCVYFTCIPAHLGFVTGIKQ